MKPQWQQEMIKSFRTLPSLLEFLELSERPYFNQLIENPTFPLIVPLAFAEKMEKGKISDPLLLQVLPQQKENEQFVNFTTDPVGDFSSKNDSGMIHKYNNRILLPITGNCAINCRYCFRQHYPYEETSYNSDRLNQSIQYILDHPEIDEIILSGGDPLSLNDDILKQILTKLNTLEQISVIRFHTRFPVVIPSRLTNTLSEILSKLDKQIIFVFHINHPNEIDSVFKTYLTTFKSNQMLYLNQAVLLKGINDSYKILSELSRKLIQFGISPYYLNQLDKVKGAAHFEVSVTHGKKLIEQLRTTLSGYMVPRYIQEVAGEQSKTVLL